MIKVLFDEESETIELHGNQAGIEKFANMLIELSQSAPSDKHLFSKEWGGEELDIESVDLKKKAMNHLKVMVWPDKK